MARPQTENLTEAEQRIMTELWRLGEASVRALTDALAPRYNLAYTTVLTTVRIMADKGYLDFRKEGRAHIYRPVLSPQRARTDALGQIARTLFGGSSKSLAQHLVEDNQLSLDDIDELRALLIARETTTSKSDPTGDPT